MNEAGKDGRAVSAALERHQFGPGALLPILHDIQVAVGYRPES